MPSFRQFFYSDRGNQIARIAVFPFKKIIPNRLRFPVSGIIRIRIPSSSQLLLNVNPTCYVGKVLFWEGIAGFESGIQNLFKFLISRSKTFVDVGANIGLYSLLAAKYNPGINVISFEPLPAGFKYLKANIEINRAVNVEAHQLALSDRSDTTTFFFSLNPKFPFVEDQLTSTGSLDRQQADRTSVLKSVSVKQMTLDQFVADSKPGQIDLLKLDTEATEHLVIDGAKETLRKYRPIVLCEVLPGRVEDEIQSRFDLMDYTAFTVTASGLTEVHDLKHDSAETNDHLFCPKEKRGIVEELITDR